MSNEGEKEVTSVYISEFPEFSSSRDLFELLGCVGDVVEVSISPRRNKVGKRFGFTRFIEKSDPWMLAVRVDNIQIGGRKIHANLPRFQRGEVVEKISRRGAIDVRGDKFSKGVHGGGAQGCGRFPVGSAAFRRENNSYAEVVFNHSRRNNA